MVDGTDQNLLGNDFRGSLFGQATSLPVGLYHHYSLWSSTIGLQVLATTHGYLHWACTLHLPVSPLSVSYHCLGPLQFHWHLHART